jgi:tRNA pseudouridine(38-40) synthase
MSKPNNTNNNKRKHWFQRKEEKKKTREFNQKVDRRGSDENWEEQTPHEGSFANENMQKLFDVQVPQFDDNEEPGAKRKVAMLLAYCGTNYGGFQINGGQRTLQAELELAMYKARFLANTNFGFPHKYGWSTSARTDKGVHACAQVISVKLAIGDLDMDSIRNKLNEHLSPDVRILEVHKTSRAFCAKTQRDRARYTYMIPSFLLYDRKELGQVFEKVLGPSPNQERRAKDPLNSDELDQLRPVLTKFRATPQHMEELRSSLRLFEGTKCFHNFTNGKTADDKSATRYIISFETLDPIILEGIEWIPTRVVGQSFLLHQIRKMVSLAVDVVRGSATRATLEHALESEEKVHVSLAPAQGLFLDMSIFDSYNRRKHKDMKDLDWITDETTPAVQRWKDFKESVVMTHIGNEEANEGNFIKYLFVQEYVFDFKKLYAVSNTKGSGEEKTIKEKSAFVDE